MLDVHIDHRYRYITTSFDVDKDYDEPGNVYKGFVYLSSPIKGYGVVYFRGAMFSTTGLFPGYTNIKVYTKDKVVAEGESYGAPNVRLVCYDIFDAPGGTGDGQLLGPHYYTIVITSERGLDLNRGYFHLENYGVTYD